MKTNEPHELSEEEKKRYEQLLAEFEKRQRKEILHTAFPILSQIPPFWLFIIGIVVFVNVIAFIL